VSGSCNFQVVIKHIVRSEHLWVFMYALIMASNLKQVVNNANFNVKSEEYNYSQLTELRIFPDF
jgi:hypothetical protein